MEKQAIWKIPVIFELCPKTPMGATVGSADIQPWEGPVPGAGPLPPLAQPNLFADAEPTRLQLPHLHRGFLLESPVHAQLSPPWIRSPSLARPPVG